MKRAIVCAICLAAGLLAGRAAGAQSFTFSTDAPDGRMGMASRPANAGQMEIEAADDFIIPGATTVYVHNATFTGLLVNGTTSGVGQVVVEIYRVFPNDSDTTRTPNVPTRANSPSDVAFDSRDAAAGTLTFTTTVLASSFTAGNSVLDGIHAAPDQRTGGEGAITGQEVQFNVTFTTPLGLPPDHYFFVPQVAMQSPNEQFYWLSSARPIVPPGTPFTPDLQAWIRNANLDPDWLRVGTDIVGGTTPPTFNGTFSLAGSVPEPGTLPMLGGALVSAWWCVRRRRR